MLRSSLFRCPGRCRCESQPVFLLSLDYDPDGRHGDEEEDDGGDGGDDDGVDGDGVAMMWMMVVIVMSMTQ